jgi:hypothetical protein
MQCSSTNMLIGVNQRRWRAAHWHVDFQDAIEPVRTVRKLLQQTFLTTATQVVWYDIQRCCWRPGAYKCKTLCGQIASHSSCCSNVSLQRRAQIPICAAGQLQGLLRLLGGNTPFPQPVGPVSGLNHQALVYMHTDARTPKPVHRKHGAKHHRFRHAALAGAGLMLQKPLQLNCFEYNEA